MRKEREEEFIIKTDSYPKAKKAEQKRANQQLEKAIVIPKGSKMLMIGFGHKVTFGMPHYEILIGIGNDHTAYLYIDEDAYKAMMAGEKLHIEH